MRKQQAKADTCKALAVYDGTRCIGFLMDRGKQGVEAFNADTKSLGVFPDQKAAADIISSTATKTETEGRPPSTGRVPNE